MSISKSMQTGAVTGVTLGLAAGYLLSLPEDDILENCMIVGGIAGAIGGSLLGVARKLNLVAYGSLLGGGTGTLIGAYYCSSLARSLIVLGISANKVLCIMAVLSSVGTIGGTVIGSVIAIIVLISQKAFEEKKLLPSYNKPRRIKLY